MKNFFNRLAEATHTTEQREELAERSRRFLAQAAQGLVDAIVENYPASVMADIAKRGNAVKKSGQYAQILMEEVSSLSPDAIRNFLDDLVTAATDETASYLYAAEAKMFAEAVDGQQIANAIDRVFENVKLPQAGMLPPQQAQMMMQMIKMQVMEPVLGLHDMLNGTSVPDLAQIIRDRAEQVPTDQIAMQIYQGIQLAAGVVAKKATETAQKKTDRDIETEAKATIDLLQLVSENLARIAHPENHKGEPEAFGADFTAKAQRHLTKIKMAGSADKIVFKGRQGGGKGQGFGFGPA